jgi:DNA mismatch repair protein MutS2
VSEKVHAWSVGAEVIVRPLGNKRGVVIEAGRSGRYRVRVEGILTWCRDDDLAAPPQPKKNRKPSQSRARLEHPAESERPAAPPGRIDLHGLSVTDAVDKVMSEIDQSVQRGADRLEIIHGKGSGLIRDALHKRLAVLTVVAAFRLDPENSGVTWVYF